MKKKETQQTKQQEKQQTPPAAPKSWKDLLIRNEKAGNSSSAPVSKATTSSKKVVASTAAAKSSSSKKDNNSSQQLTEMFLGNVSPDTTVEKVTAIYEVFGTVTDVKLLPERKHGFFKFVKAESARKALKAQENGQIKSPFKIEIRKGNKKNGKKRRK